MSREFGREDRKPAARSSKNVEARCMIRRECRSSRGLPAKHMLQILANIWMILNNFNHKALGSKRSGKARFMLQKVYEGSISGASQEGGTVLTEALQRYKVTTGKQEESKS